MRSLFFEIFRSVELVWALWFVSLATFVGMVIALKRMHLRRRARALHGCEAGAAYSLSYMLTIPFFALIICLMIDLTSILIAKIGTVYAAYAAARSAVVWYPSGVSTVAAKEKMTDAAVNAMTPFASSKHTVWSSFSPADAASYVAAYEAFAEPAAPAEYVAKKYLYARWGLDVATDAGLDYRKDVTVTVDYKAPYHLRGIGLLLGTREPIFGFYYSNIHTVVTLESQAPRVDRPNPADRPLGIKYVPAIN